MRRLAAIILALLLSLPAVAQTTDEAAANSLFVEAVEAWRRAEGLAGEDLSRIQERLRALRIVDGNLRRIVEQHKSSSLAVKLVVGERIGPLGLADTRRAIEAAQQQEKEALLKALDEAADRNVRAHGGAPSPPALIYRPGAVFRDCAECPEMVVIPAGSAALASGLAVAIERPFAVGKFEVTFSDWDACFSQGGCVHRPDAGAQGQGRYPVVSVNWDDAQQFVTWLSRKTGKTYRLLSEAEWEYAAQAGSNREVVAREGAHEANCWGCGNWSGAKQTSPVGSFPANAFGLHDMLGNVWEWTADCWHESMSDAPADGSARQNGDCSRRIPRGGSWIAFPSITRSSWRHWYEPTNRPGDIGFRVARTL